MSVVISLAGWLSYSSCRFTVLGTRLWWYSLGLFSALRGGVGVAGGESSSPAGSSGAGSRSGRRGQGACHGTW